LPENNTAMAITHRKDSEMFKNALVGASFGLIVSALLIAVNFSFGLPNLHLDGIQSDAAKAVLLSVGLFCGLTYTDKTLLLKNTLRALAYTVIMFVAMFVIHIFDRNNAMGIDDTAFYLGFGVFLGLQWDKW
jgi:hypothetical protein